jgi:hypothetical protein
LNRRKKQTSILEQVGYGRISFGSSRLPGKRSLDFQKEIGVTLGPLWVGSTRSRNPKLVDQRNR